MSDSPAASTSRSLVFPPGFGPRRGLNWLLIGSLYASYYMCRYNFRMATPFLRDTYSFSKEDIAQILSCWFWAYGIGQMVNGLLADKIGGKRAMLIGAAGTIVANLVFGASSIAGGFWTFALIWLINGYFQSFGAPGMVKMNAAWFQRTERGAFAGVFGFMIQLGQMAINRLGPVILAGFTIGVWVLPANQWKWLFWLPPAIVVVAAILLALFVRQSPEEAGFHGVIHDELSADAGVTTTLKDSFRTIFSHPLVWYYAVAYACTGVVRQSSDQFAVLFFVERLGLSTSDPALVSTLQLMPFVAVLGSFASGVISDRFFKGHRSPVAMFLYFFEAVVIGTGAWVVSHNVSSVFISCLFLVLIALTANSTHSIVGAAAPMDIGGRKMAGFAAGVIDAFQYFGPGLCLPIIGRMIDRHGWVVWFPSMALFGVIGGIAMILVMAKQRRLRAAAAPA